MAKQFDQMLPEHRAFIEKQRIFFVASAAPRARINLSPKGLDTLRVLDEHSIVYMDLTGSGNETAAHLKADGRMTFMVCAFEGPPQILRLYGRGRVIPRGGSEYAQLLDEHFGGEEHIGARQMVRLDATMVQTSCGYAVPNLSFKTERAGLDAWAEKQGPEGLVTYRQTKNQASIDGLPTGLVEPAE